MVKAFAFSEARKQELDTYKLRVYWWPGGIEVETTLEYLRGAR